MTTIRNAVQMAPVVIDWFITRLASVESPAPTKRAVIAVAPEGDEREQVGDQPEGVDHQRHGGDVGIVAEQVAGEPHVGEADQQVQHLLGEHGHGEPQHRAERARRFDEHAHGERGGQRSGVGGEWRGESRGRW